MQVKIICKYCGFNWIQHVYSREAADKLKCPQCKDSNLTIKELKLDKIDTYAGAPPFPEKKSKETKQPYDPYTDFGL